MQPQPWPRRRPSPPTAHVRRPEAWDPPDRPLTSTSTTSAHTLTTALGPVRHVLTQACRDKCEIASERASAPRHRAARLVRCMEHAHAAARAVRGGSGRLVCVCVWHAACLRGAEVAPRRGDLAIASPATRCLRASIEDDGVHLGHQDERLDVLQHALVENPLPH